MVFVTGGTGMLGSYLLLELAQQNKHIIAAKRSSSSTDVTRKIFQTYSNNASELLDHIQWVEVDLFSQTDIEQHLDGIKEVYHCAAMISPSPKKRKELLFNNQKITENMVNAALQIKIEKFCYVSSIAALGSEVEGKLASEKTLWKESKNNSGYSISKYYSEMEVWRGIAEGLNAVIVNPSVILGIGDWNKGSAQLIQTINNGLKYYTLGSSGFVDAEDTAKIMIQLMEKENAFGQAFIISSENRTYKSIFDSISESLSVKAPKTHATPMLTQIAWRLEKIKSKLSGKDALITKESAQTAHKKLSYDNSKLLNLIDFKYKAVDTSIKEIAQIFLDEHKA